MIARAGGAKHGSGGFHAERVAHEAPIIGIVTQMFVHWHVDMAGRGGGVEQDGVGAALIALHLGREFIGIAGDHAVIIG